MHEAHTNIEEKKMNKKAIRTYTHIFNIHSYQWTLLLTLVLYCVFELN